MLSILTFIYLGVTSGLAMEVHYCMGQQAGFELFGSEKDRCGRCGMKENKSGCCHDEHSFYKLTIDQKHVVNDISFDQVPVIILSEFFIQSYTIQGQTYHPAAQAHSPPLLRTGSETCVLNSIFRL